MIGGIGVGCLVVGLLLFVVVRVLTEDPQPCLTDEEAAWLHAVHERGDNFNEFFEQDFFPLVEEANENLALVHDASWRVQMLATLDIINAMVLEMARPLVPTEKMQPVQDAVHKTAANLLLMVDSFREFIETDSGEALRRATRALAAALVARESMVTATAALCSE